MEITIYEMAWLCQIIKVKKLMGFEAFAILTKDEADNINKGLVEKQILKDGKLTEKGLALVEALNLYVNSKKFIKLGENSVFANYQGKEFVLITKDDEKFSVNMVTQDHIVTIILSKFKTLNTIKDKEYIKTYMSKHKFAEIMKLYDDAESVFYHMVNIETKTEKKAVMYVADGYFQHYDAVLEELKQYPRYQVQQGIESIFDGEEI